MTARTKPPHHQSASNRGELLLIAVCVVTLALAQFPQVVLHDQYDNDLKDSSVYEIRPDPPEPSAEAVDNFVIPASQTWQSSRQL